MNENENDYVFINRNQEKRSNGEYKSSLNHLNKNQIVEYSIQITNEPIAKEKIICSYKMFLAIKFGLLFTDQFSNVIQCIGTFRGKMISLWLIFWCIVRCNHFYILNG